MKTIIFNTKISVNGDFTTKTLFYGVLFIPALSYYFYIVTL